MARSIRFTAALLILVAFSGGWRARAQEPAPRGTSSYTPVTEGDIEQTVRRMSAAKPDVMKKQMALLEERYDLSDKPAAGVTMARGKPVQGGIRAKLPAGAASWEALAGMAVEEIRDKGLWPRGFLPLLGGPLEGLCQLFHLRQLALDLRVFAQPLARPAQGFVFLALAQQAAELARLLVDHNRSSPGNASAYRGRPNKS